jgi:hypothetical protein
MGHMACISHGAFGAAILRYQTRNGHEVLMSFQNLSRVLWDTFYFVSYSD